MGTADRRAREKDRKRRAILGAAIRCFGKKGYDATTLDDVAKVAEVAKGTLYLYFKNKADLFATLLLEQGFDVFDEALEKRLWGTKTAHEATRAFARCFQELCLDGKKELFDFFIQLDRGDISKDLSPTIRDEARRRHARSLSRISGFINRGRNSGELSGPEGRRTALVFWAFCVGVAHLAKSGFPAKRVLDDGMSILLQGITNES